MNGNPCSNCERLRRERDEARAELARAREEAEALRLALPAFSERAADPFGGRGLDMPLRYRLADSLNDGLKKWLKPVHSAGKQLAARAGRGRRHG